MEMLLRQTPENVQLALEPVPGWRSFEEAHAATNRTFKGDADGGSEIKEQKGRESLSLHSEYQVTLNRMLVETDSKGHSLRSQPETRNALLEKEGRAILITKRGKERGGVVFLSQCSAEGNT